MHRLSHPAIQQLFTSTHEYRRGDVAAPMVLCHLLMACERCFEHILIHCQRRNHLVRFSSRTNPLPTGALTNEISTIITYIYMLLTTPIMFMLTVTWIYILTILTVLQMYMPLSYFCVILFVKRATIVYFCMASVAIFWYPMSQS